MQNNLPPVDIQNLIYRIRGRAVMFDSDLAALYRVGTKRLNEAVKRNRRRFPEDFMFQLTQEEIDCLRSQIATSKKVRGGRRYLPYVFTEQGVAMLSCVLNSEKAIDVNLHIMRAFVRLRHMILESDALRLAIEGLEKRTTKNERDIQLAMTYLQKILFPPPDHMIPKPRKIGFVQSDD